MVRIRLTVAAALACSCGDDGATQPQPTTTGGEQCASKNGEWRSCGIAFEVVAGVDLLFVVDRSARMGSAQAKLARAMPELVAALGELPAGMGARVAFIEVEAPLPACPGVAWPELALRSCREHLDDFVRDDGTDVRAPACTDVCMLDAIPTTTGPWIEWDDATNNVGGLDIASALACAAPQGIAGCELPAPIGAIEHAIDDYATDKPVITIVVSDAADCTLAGDGDLIFDPESNRTFWTDPDASAPMPAICWNAGVTCTGPSTGYAACAPADKDFLGAPSGPDRVLSTPDARLDVSGDVVGIVGVPIGWQRGDAIPYADASDPAVQLAYGIGPACTASDGSFGLPSPRVQAFVEANPSDPSHATDLFSICADDWGPTMHAIVDLARDLIPPSCMPACVADVDAADGLQVECELTLERAIDGEVVSDVLPSCDAGGVVPAGAPGCWSPLTGDARSPTCRDSGFNLEVALHWPGVIPHGAVVSPSCSVSDDRARDCPDLPH